MNLNDFNWDEMIRHEINQLKEEGKDVSQLSITNYEKASKESYLKLCEDADTLPLSDDYPYKEPSHLHEIKKESPGWDQAILHTTLPPHILFDKIYGAWLGRAAGCLLGKPVEGWSQSEIKKLLENNDAYPLGYYFSARFKPTVSEDWKNEEYIQNVIEHCQGMPRDDDLDYTILALKTVEKYGANFQAKDIAHMWLTHLPVLMTYTAERIAYLNLCSGIDVEKVAIHRNPYREWIGAQIRSDFYGYIYPGDPKAAAKLAFQDAFLSHRGNGIYGAMFVAAMNAVCFVESDIKKIILTAINYIPKQSRLYEAIQWVVDQFDGGNNQENVGKQLLKRYGNYYRVHTINNATIVVYALLYGAGDLEKTLSICVSMGLDTDSTGATVGSIVGIINGAQQLPEKWTKPLHNQIDSFVAGEGAQTISSLASRTVNVIQ